MTRSSDIDFLSLQVIFFPSSCDPQTDCACRDPKAPENRKDEHVYSLGWEKECSHGKPSYRLGSSKIFFQICCFTSVPLLSCLTPPCQRVSLLSSVTSWKVYPSPTHWEEKKKDRKKEDRCGNENIPMCSKEGMFFSHQTRKKKKKMIDSG